MTTDKLGVTSENVDESDNNDRPTDPVIVSSNHYRVKETPKKEKEPQINNIIARDTYNVLFDEELQDS